MTTAYEKLCTLHREMATLSSVGALLNWDQETYMPHAGAGFRAEQQAMIAGMVHERRTDPRIGELIAACEGDRGLMGNADAPAARNVREMRRDYDLATKLPKELVEELAKVGSQAQEAWKDAREKNDFPMFAPWLERMMELTRRKAECYGVPPGGELYDALLNEYEPGMKAAEIEAIFRPLRERLGALIGRIAASGKQVDTAPINVEVDPERQHTFGLFVLEAMGFDLRAGRLDTTTHPFCSGMAPGDTRLTTRYRGEKFTDALYGTMHEMGHGLYEQGLPKEDMSIYGTPLADAISLGIHESQSRMWENFVGRSREFWVWALPHAERMLGPGFKGQTVEGLYRAVNTCTPSFIRVEADEATYNLHVMLRFELERAIFRGDLKVRDVPEVWNARFKEFLGLDVPDAKRGALQDVHWSFGLIGYFPTYTLGNLYCAQFWEKIEEDISDLRSQISKGEFAPLLSWLREKIHKHGRRWRASELCEKVTGKALSADPLMRHLEGKLGPVYGV